MYVLSVITASTDKMNPNKIKRTRSKLALISTSPQLFISHATRFI